MLTALQKKTIEAIINVFETGSAHGDYAQVTVMRGDSGGLTYGRAQTTLNSGNLYLLIKAYCEAEGAEYAEELKTYLLELEERNVKLDSDTKLHTLLREAGSDPIMRTVQNQFFDRIYFAPAWNAVHHRIHSPLGIAVVYDSFVHGSWAKLRDLTNVRCGALSSVPEQVWVAAYVETRRSWLSTHSNSLLHRTVYRMDTFLRLITEGNWTLQLPLIAHGTLITEDILRFPRPVRASAEERPRRLLKVSSPPMEGHDVSDVQHALSRHGFAVPATAVYDKATVDAVTLFQRARGLKADGIVGPTTRVFLESATLPSGSVREGAALFRHDTLPWSEGAAMPMESVLMSDFRAFLATRGSSGTTRRVRSGVTWRSTRGTKVVASGTQGYPSTGHNGHAGA